MKFFCTSCDCTNETEIVSMDGTKHDGCKENGYWVIVPPDPLFAKIKEHIGHKIVAVMYGNQNVAIECETCNCVIIDADRYSEDDDE